ncbi:MAG: aldose 1-epimerase family protein [Candidatus Latescibacteria bacterium]|nr:aldose 1-epimerase family protein [Candidatus Latescibacterota bacterium]
MPHLFGRDYSKRELLDLVGDISQVANTRRAELVEGNERGADLIEVFNASGLCLSILPGRALDVASAHYKGMSLCFRGNTGDVGPAFYEPQGYGWMRGFYGGLVLTCGMTFTGHPEVDSEEEDEELGLHGRLSFLPAKNVVADGQWIGDDYVIRIGGKMREAIPFGTHLELTREISMVLGEKSFHIHDRIENHNVERSPLMLVYHCNPGFPVLDVGTRIAIDSESTTEWTEDRQVGPEVYTTASAPKDVAEDNVFVHRVRADSQGNSRVGMINDDLGLGIFWKFPQEEIPIVNQWQHFHRGTYVTGVEPGNASMLGRAWNRKHGTLQYIEPEEVREFHMEIGVLDGAEEISAFDASLR